VSPLLATGGAASAYWYLTRGTGVVSLLLLTLVVVLGVSGVTRWRTERMPRFVVAGLHRNLTLLSIVFVAAHVVTTVADGYAPVSLRDAVVPFVSAYRPFWLGLGAVAFDLLLALTVTSLLRARVGFRTWRALHWLAYAAWPVALVHSFGSGSDARVGWMEVLGAACTLLVAAAVVRRLANGSSWTAARGTALAAVAIVPLLLLVWYRSGPGKAGWAARAGTPAALLGAKSASLPSPPFTSSVRGRIVESSPDATGSVTVGIDLVSAVGMTRVWLRGRSVAGGGVAVGTSRIAFGTIAVPDAYVGRLASLEGGRMTAVLRNGAGSALDVVLALSIDRSRGTVAGVLHATSGGA
jgi:DMSO/TMAO reductase YedYZ heme-binding membrane subunit